MRLNIFRYKCGWYRINEMIYFGYTLEESIKRYLREHKIK